MEDIIKLENRTTKLCEDLIKISKTLKSKTYCDVTLNMNLIVIGPPDIISVVQEMCKNNNNAKFTVNELVDGFCRIAIHFE